MEKRVSAMQVRKNLGQLLEKAYYRGDTFIIQRAAKPMAVLIPIEQYEQWQLRREQFFALIDQVQERTCLEPIEELEDVIAEAVESSKQVERGTEPSKTKET
jgi:prevent-host-death family protein